MKPSGQPPTIRFRSDIQGLRALAIAIVVGNHAGIPGFAGGFIGVDLFFVLSGFLITALLVQERRESGSIQYGRFLARRLRRLMPALLVMLASVYLMSWALLSTYEASMQTGSFAFAMTWTSNFYFALSEFDYFATLKSKDFFLHTWTLGVEEQFYVVWPWLVLVAFSLSKRESPLLPIVACVLAGGLALCLYWSDVEPLLAFYMMPARSWQFAAGAAVCLLMNRVRVPAPILTGAGVGGILIIASSTLLLGPRLNYPGFYALAPTMAAVLLLLAGANDQTRGVSRVLSRKPLVWLGDRSYSLYLWHWPVLLIGAEYGISDTQTGTASLIAVSMLMAMLSYTLIELPFWKGRLGFAPPRLIALSAVLAATAVIALGNTVSSRHIDHHDRAAGHKMRNDTAVFTAGLQCDSWYHNSDVVPCISGSEDALHTAVLIGDSIGTQWSAMMPEIFKAPGWRVVVLTKSACAMADVDYFYAPAGGVYDVCTLWRRRSIEFLTRMRPDIIFVGSSAHVGFSKEEWISGSRSVLSSLAAAADKVVVIPGTPALSFDGPSCVQEPYRFTSRLVESGRFCEEPMTDVLSEEVAGHLAQAARSFPNVHLLPLSDLVCPERRCAALTEDGLPVFRDQYHLTASFVKAQAPVVRARLEAIGTGLP